MAQAAYKERSPELIRERDRDWHERKRSAEREEMGLPFPAGHIAKRLYRTWSAEDVERWFAWAKKRGARVVVNKTTLEKLSSMDLVPNEPFRVAYEAVPEDHKDEIKTALCKESGLTESGLIERLGMKMKYGPGAPLVRIFMDYKLAESCCKAMGLLPPECGI